MSELVRPYNGVSAPERTAARRARLLDAALEVVGRDGLSATTVGAVCEQAGLTKRYFYESFPDLGALLEEVLEGLHASLLADIRDTLADVPADPVRRAQLTVARLLAAMDDTRMARLYVEAAGHPGLAARRQAAYEVYAELVASEVLGLSDRDPHARVRALVFVTGTTQVVIDWLEGTVDLSREDLVVELAKVAVG